MATGLDQVVGMAMMSLGSLIFIYYTLWVVLLPFVDADHVIQSYFPDRMYAMLIPVVAGVLALLVIGMNPVLFSAIESRIHAFSGRLSVIVRQ